MKKTVCVWLAVLLVLSACAPAASATWREQYDLGVRYLSEGKYEEAVIAFNAAIEIDRSRADAYIGLADAYAAQGDAEQARRVLADALAIVTDADAIRSRLDGLEESAAPEPTPGPTPEPTPEPATEPTAEPAQTPAPTQTTAPTAAPTPTPTPAAEPAAGPTPEPASRPTPAPAPEPAPEPTAEPGPVYLLTQQTEYLADGTLLAITVYQHDSRGRTLSRERTWWPDGLPESNITTFEYTGEVLDGFERCRVIPDRRDYESEEEWLAAQYEILVSPGEPFDIGHSGGSIAGREYSNCTSALLNPEQRAAVIANGGVLTEEDSNHHDSIWAYAVYTFDEAGNPVSSITYNDAGAVTGTATLEWRLLGAS